MQAAWTITCNSVLKQDLLPLFFILAEMSKAKNKTKAEKQPHILKPGAGHPCMTCWRGGPKNVSVQTLNPSPGSGV